VTASMPLFAASYAGYDLAFLGGINRTAQPF
jgi:hypothetical protein